MIYVALLRGINVGGNNKVDMRQLKAVFEHVGMGCVSTYINSGNVFFIHPSRNPTELAGMLEDEINKEFGFVVKVLVLSIDSIRAIVGAIPSKWKNDSTMKCDVMYLWEAIDSQEVVTQLTVKPGIDDVKYVPGALIWTIDRQNASKSGLMKIIGTPLYAQMTIRNCNTARKLLERMEELASD